MLIPQVTIYLLLASSSCVLSFLIFWFSDAHPLMDNSGGTHGGSFLNYVHNSLSVAFVFLLSFYFFFLYFTVFNVFTFHLRGRVHRPFYLKVEISDGSSWPIFSLLKNLEDFTVVVFFHKVLSESAGHLVFFPSYLTWYVCLDAQRAFFFFF